MNKPKQGPIQKLISSVDHLSPSPAAFLLWAQDYQKKCEQAIERLSQIPTIASLSARVKHVYQYGVDLGEKTGWPELDEFYTVRRGEMSILTGVPGSGKTTWLDALLINLATLKGWKFAMYSAENMPLDRHIATLTEQHVGLPFRKGPSERINEAQLVGSLEFLNDHFRFIAPIERECTVSGILYLTSTIDKESKLDGLVVDPWNEIDHTRPSWCTETEYISRKLTEIRRFARDKNIHIWVVAHPNKPTRNKDGDYPIITPYDISGGAHWRNKADNCIAVCRNFKDESREIDILIQKIRYREIGRIGSQKLYFNTRNCRYYQSEYELRNS